MFHLRRDGRLSNADLARRVGLTPPPCLRRVRRLEEQGIISGYRARIDPAASGRGFEVFVDVEVAMTDSATLEEFERTVMGWDEVVEMRRLYGTPDYLLRVMVADNEAYDDWQTHQLIGLPGVNRVISHKTLRVIKVDD